MKPLKINELMEITGLTRPTIKKYIKAMSIRGSKNVVFNEKLKIYMVRNIDIFYEELNNKDEKEHKCQQKNKRKVYTKEKIASSTGSYIMKKELELAYQLRRSL